MFNLEAERMVRQVERDLLAQRRTPLDAGMPRGRRRAPPALAARLVQLVLRLRPPRAAPSPPAPQIDAGNGDAALDTRATQDQHPGGAAWPATFATSTRSTSARRRSSSDRPS